MAYLVTFETDAARQESLVTAIKAFGDWGVVTRASYLLISEHPLRTIIETLQPMLGPKDSLAAVLTISAPWAAYCDPIVEDMIEGLLGKCEDHVPKDWNGVDWS